MQLTVIQADITIQPSTLPNATEGTAYDVQFQASGGAGAPYTFSSPDSPDLPPGVGLSPQGELKGVPSKPGTYNFALQVSDAAGNTATF